MGGDYTRFTFDPVKGYNALLRQQGRVGLDADHNEANEIGDRRWRSETWDIIGRCVVPSTTPDAFLVAVAAPTFTIGLGRAYVDGIQVENFGDPDEAATWDVILAELKRSTALPYEKQPFLPVPPAIDTDPGTTHLIYLDVWYREIDFLMDPAIREKALGGPDTATRVQTVWQVRALELGDGDFGCEDEIAAWTQLTEPSSGRLTTDTEPPAPEDNPCILSPDGGYRGPENRLYRVEIHSVANDGSAGLKWSRDNASVKAAVTAINGAELTVDSLGRDGILSFHDDDWVEVLDEHVDLDPTRSGEMARIVAIREADRVLELDTDLQATALFDPTDEGRRTRVVRWDQEGPANSNNGLIPIPAALPPGGFEVDIEDGILVRLELDTTLANPRFHVKDHWVFPARTADSSAGPLVKAPPRGIHHHYCRLAMVTWPDDVEDCRDPWPPDTADGEGCCTAVVHPGEDIQAAIDSLPPEGGCVCLKAGDHLVEDAVVIGRPNVHLHGESPGARVIRAGALPVLQVVASDVVVETVDLVSQGMSAEPDSVGIGVEPPHAAILWVVSAARVDFRRVGIEAVTRTRIVWITGAFMRGTEDVRFSGCRFDGLPVGIVGASGSDLVVEDSEFLAQPYTEFGVRWGAWGIYTRQPHSLVLRNRFVEFETAVEIHENAFDGRVEANRILRDGQSLWGGEDGTKVYAVEAGAEGAAVVDNSIQIPDPDLGGIRLAARIASATGNRIESSVTPLEEELPIGVMVEGAFGFPSIGTDRETGEAPEEDAVLVADNRIFGLSQAIVVSGTWGTVVRDNHLQCRGVLQDAVGIHLQQTTDARVSGNVIRGFTFGVFTMVDFRSRIEGNHVFEGLGGIVGYVVFEPVVTGNVIERTEQFGCGLLFEFGGFARLADNRVTGCGWVGGGSFGGGLGLGVVVGLGEVEVVDCQVIDTGVPPPDKDRVAQVAYGIALGFVRRIRVEGNVVSFRALERQDLHREDRALAAIGISEGMEGEHRGEHRVVVGGTAQVLDNEFVGPGRTCLVELGRITVMGKTLISFEKLSFGNNHCLHLARTTDSQFATVWLLGEHQIVMGNHVKSTDDGIGSSDFFSFDFNHNRRVALMGNISTGDYLNLGGSVPTPPLNFNIVL